jgi:hypothetical protein
VLKCSGRNIRSNYPINPEGRHIMQWTEAEIKETLAEIGRRSANDADYRALALRDAKAAIQRITSKPIPDDFTVKFIEDSGAGMTVVLPPAKSNEGVLSEQELEMVSGGGGAINKSASSLNVMAGMGGGFTPIGTNLNSFYVKL